MGSKALLGRDLYYGFLKGLEELNDVEGSVAKVMRKYGEGSEEEGMVYDEYGNHSLDDDMAIRIAGDNEVSDYWEGLSVNGGGVDGVLDYLCDRFSCVDEDIRHEVRVDMLRWVLDEARKVEGKVSA